MNYKLQEWIEKEIREINIESRRRYLHLWKRQFPLTVFGCVVCLMAIGFLVKAPIETIFRVHFVSGLALGVVSGLITALCQIPRNSVKHVIKKLNEELTVLETDAEQQEFALEMLEGPKEHMDYKEAGEQRTIIFCDNYYMQKSIVGYEIVPVRKVETIISFVHTSTYQGDGYRIKNNSYAIQFHSERLKEKKLGGILNVLPTFSFMSGQMKEQAENIIHRRLPSIPIEHK